VGTTDKIEKFFPCRDKSELAVNNIFLVADGILLQVRFMELMTNQ
jgi:hypothetical protein